LKKCRLLAAGITIFLLFGLIGVVGRSLRVKQLLPLIIQTFHVEEKAKTSTPNNNVEQLS
jgi:hypothetical protein